MNREIGDTQDLFYWSDDELSRTDELLTKLSQGGGSSDELTTMLAQLRADLNRDLPDAPNLEALLGEAYFEDLSDSVAGGSPDELAARRDRRMPTWAAGFFGAAAAAVLILGSGGIIHAAKPGDALWSANQAIFGNKDNQDQAVIDLASTLQQAEEASKNGDTEGAERLLAQAHALLAKLNKDQQVEWESQVKSSESLIKEQPTSPGQPSSAKPKDEKANRSTTTANGTVTVTETTTVTETASPSQQSSGSQQSPRPDVRSEPAPAPEPAEPSPAPTTTSTPAETKQDGPTYSAPAPAPDADRLPTRPPAQLHSVPTK